MEDLEVPDLRVGVLAARTFYVHDGRFYPVGYVFQRGISAACETWFTADAVARCYIPADPMVGRCGCGCGGMVWAGYSIITADTVFQSHQAPADGCECGLYSFTSAQEVWDQYRGQGASNVLAVVSLEGQAVEGSRGWRSERARIVAAWVRNDEVRQQLAVNYPTVTFYADGAALLADYPAVDNGTSGGLYPPPGPSMADVSWHRGVVVLNSNWTGLTAALAQVGQAVSRWQTVVWTWPSSSPEDEDGLPLAERAARALARGDLGSLFYLSTDKRASASFLACSPAPLSSAPPVYAPDWDALAAAAANTNPPPSYAEQNRRRLDGTNRKASA